MNDFEHLVCQYKEKLDKTEIKSALRLLLEKKNDARVNTTNIFLNILIPFSTLIIGINIGNIGINGEIINNSLQFILIIIAAILFLASIIFPFLKPYDIKIDYYEQYLDAIILLETNCIEKPSEVKSLPITNNTGERQFQFDLAIFQSIEQINMSSNIAIFIFGATLVITSYQITTVLLNIKISDIMFWGGEIIAIYSFSSIVYYLLKMRKEKINKIARYHNLQYHDD